MTFNFPKKRKQNKKLLEERRKEPCWSCGNPPPNDASHIKTRGSGGPDEPFNVVTHCRKCHIEWGMSAIKFLERHPAFAFRLMMLRWTWEGGKLTNPSLYPVSLNQDDL